MFVLLGQEIKPSGIVVGLNTCKLPSCPYQMNGSLINLYLGAAEPFPFSTIFFPISVCWPLCCSGYGCESQQGCVSGLVQKPCPCSFTPLLKINKNPKAVEK